MAREIKRHEAVCSVLHFRDKALGPASLHVSTTNHTIHPNDPIGATALTNGERVAAAALGRNHLGVLEPDRRTVEAGDNAHCAGGATRRRVSRTRPGVKLLLVTLGAAVGPHEITGHDRRVRKDFRWRRERRRTAGSALGRRLSHRQDCRRPQAKDGQNERGEAPPR